MNDKLISVIIPVYNTSEYIKRCIDSIGGQTYRNLEIICIDDGSTDGSGEILDGLGEKDRRIIVIHNQNTGVSNARNTGLTHANGDFIGFVDSDDWIEPCMFEKLFYTMEKHNVDIGTVNYYIDQGTSSRIASNKKSVMSDVSINTRDFLRYIYERDTYKGVAGYLWTRLFKREILYGNPPLRFKKEYGGTDDIVFVAEASIRSNKYCYIDEPLYHYYQREGSIVHDDRKQLEDMTWPASYEYILKLFSKNNVPSDVVEMVQRMYVYRCGRLLEYAITCNDRRKAQTLRRKIYIYYDEYVRTNGDYPERIEWLSRLMGESK